MKIKILYFNQNISGIDSDKKWKTRLNTLKETIYYWVENRSDKMIEVIHLFYDENNIIEDSECSTPLSTES